MYSDNGDDWDPTTDPDLLAELAGQDDEGVSAGHEGRRVE